MSPSPPSLLFPPSLFPFFPFSLLILHFAICTHLGSFIAKCITRREKRDWEREGVISLFDRGPIDQRGFAGSITSIGFLSLDPFHPLGQMGGSECLHLDPPVYCYSLSLCLAPIRLCMKGWIGGVVVPSANGPNGAAGAESCVKSICV